MKQPIEDDMTNSDPIRKNRLLAAIAAVAAAGLMVATPAAAHDRDDHDHHFSINTGKDGELLEKLIELDADGIEDMRADIAEARDDIADAMDDVAEAREEASEAPGGRFIVRIAFSIARGVTAGAVKGALEDVREELDDAERTLPTMDISDEEKVETQYAIDVLRSDLEGLEDSLDDLIEALRA